MPIFFPTRSKTALAACSLPPRGQFYWFYDPYIIRRFYFRLLRVVTLRLPLLNCRSSSFLLKQYRRINNTSWFRFVFSRWTGSSMKHDKRVWFLTGGRNSISGCNSSLYLIWYHVCLVRIDVVTGSLIEASLYRWCRTLCLSLLYFK